MGTFVLKRRKAPPTSSSPASSHRTEKSGLTDENSEDMKIAKIKQQLVREFLAETLGTFILVLFGNGAIAQLTGQGGDPFIHIAFGYGLALTLGILASGGVSGGHLNPAVTLAMATLKKCKWIQPHWKRANDCPWNICIISTLCKWRVFTKYNKFDFGPISGYSTSAYYYSLSD